MKESRTPPVVESKMSRSIEEILDLLESVMNVAVLPITLDREKVLDLIEELRRKLDTKNTEHR